MRCSWLRNGDCIRSVRQGNVGALGQELLPKVEPEAGQRVRKSLTAHGVVALISARVSSMGRLPHRSVKVTLSRGDSAHSSEGLIATGRRPRKHDVRLDKVGIQGHRLLLNVNDSLRIDSVPGGLAVCDRGC